MTDSDAPSPLGLSTWLPVLRGGDAPRYVLRPEDGAAAARARWDALAAGERLALVGEGAPGSHSPLAALEAALNGAPTIERFVALPGTGGGTVMLPAHSPAVLRGGLALLPSGRRRWRAARLGLGSLAPLGLARRLGLTEVVIATRDAPVAGPDALADEREHVALAVGPPDGRQKVVARILDGLGATRAIAKIGRQGDAAIDREGEGLRTLGRLAPELAPALLGSGATAGRPWVLQEPLLGRRSPDVFTTGHAAFLSRLAHVAPGRSTVSEHPFVAASRARLSRLSQAEDPEWFTEVDALTALLGDCADEVPTGLAHGDFTSWNLAVGARGMRAFDWEDWRPDAPALHDLFHFHFRTGVLVHRRDGAGLLDALQSVCARPGRQLVEAAGLEPGSLLRCLAIYLLDASTRAEESQRQHPAASLQVGWQRRARRELVRRVVGLLRERRVPWTLTLPHSRGNNDAA